MTWIDARGFRDSGPSGRGSGCLSVSRNPIALLPRSPDREDICYAVYDCLSRRADAEKISDSSSGDLGAISLGDFLASMFDDTGWEFCPMTDC